MKKALFVLAAVAVAGVAIALLGRDRREHLFVQGFRPAEPLSGPDPLEDRETEVSAPVEVTTPAAVETFEPVQPPEPVFTEAIEPAEIEAAAPETSEVDEFESEWDKLEPEVEESEEPFYWDEVVQSWTT